MSRSGQMPADYGEHWTPETVWSSMDDCPRCLVRMGEPCIDMRYKHTVPVTLWNAHPNRPVVSVLDGRTVK